jgi:Protein of unknown function (DUF3703)
MSESTTVQGFDAVVYAGLLKELERLANGDAAQRWQLLEAAHVVGQTRFGPHLRTHALMLGQAWRTRDGRELIGQLFRLLLVPLGHVFGRLPLGNPGRANISAFQPMPVRADLAQLIDQVRLEMSSVTASGA